MTTEPSSTAKPVSIAGTRPAIRIATCIALLVLLWLTIAVSVSATLARQAPELALRLAPWNAEAAGQLAQQIISTRPNERDYAQTLANQALRRDPTVISGVVAAGTIQGIKGDFSESARIFTYAEWLSRRNLPTELWWIENGVSRGDIAFALRHYDIALRTNRYAPDVLFPILGSAISDIKVRDGLVALISKNPPWKDRFFRWIITNGIDNISTALLFEELKRSNNRIDPSFVGKLEWGLIDERHYEAAWRLYQIWHPEASRDRSRDKYFKAAASGRKSPFDWNVVIERGAAVIGEMEGRSVLRFTTLSTDSGILARQFQLLSPGRYRLMDVASIENVSATSRPYWLLSCIDGRELGRIPLDFGKFSREALTIPGDCPAQWFALANDSSDAISDVTGTVELVSLQKIH